MDKKIILFIGNKPYVEADLNDMLDSLTENTVRHNMTLPGKNNGTICDKLYLCQHLNNNVIARECTLDNMLAFYGSEYKHECIIDFVKSFNKDDYSLIGLLDGPATNVDAFNEFLQKLTGDPEMKFTAYPRTGFISLMNSVIKHKTEIENGDVVLLVFGYSVVDEVRTSYYVKHETSMNESVCHNKTDELKIITWLHNHSYIDATLCMLTDTKNLIISTNGTTMKPTNRIMNIIEKYK